MTSVNGWVSEIMRKEGVPRNIAMVRAVKKLAEGHYTVLDGLVYSKNLR